MQTLNGRTALYRSALHILENVYSALGIVWEPPYRAHIPITGKRTLCYELHTPLAYLHYVSANETGDVERVLRRVLPTDPAYISLLLIHKALHTEDDLEATETLCEALRWSRRAALEQGSDFKPVLFTLIGGRVLDSVLGNGQNKADHAASGEGGVNGKPPSSW